jgi:hypothetical protein
MSQDDDQLVERVARAIIEARFADDDDGYDMPVTDYDRDLARAALSAMPQRELLREALEALEPFAKEGANWSPNFPDTQGFSTKTMPNYEAGDLAFQPAYTMGDLRRARAAADKIRAAMEQQP